MVDKAAVKTAIIIPARYGSTRFPGKPLVKIGGKTMLERVFSIGQKAATAHKNVTVAVATEDSRIKDYCDSIGAPCFITSPDCATGSDRVLEASEKAGGDFDYIINFQADRPFTHPIVLTSLIGDLKKYGSIIEVITPVHRLSWEELDELEQSKEKTPFSGTTVVRHEFDNKEKGIKAGYAIWFSKKIIPAIRNVDQKKAAGEDCPVLKHIGIYGYRKDILKEYAKLSSSFYEQHEGLEQLRMLENGISIFTTKVVFGKNDESLRKLQIGIDSPEDVAKAELLLKEYGEPL